MSTYKALVGLLFLLVAPAMAGSLPPLEAYGSLPSVSLMTLSPSGNRVAYRRTTSEQDVILVVDLESGQAVGGAGVGEVGARKLVFADDDNLIIIAGRTMRALGFRGQFDYSSAIHLHVPTREVRNLLKGARYLYPGQSGLGQIIGISGDRRSLLMPAFNTDDPGVTAPTYGVYGVPLGKERASLMQKGGAHTIDWFAGADGQLLAHEDFDGERDRYTIWSLAGERKLIYQRETDVPPAGPVGLAPGKDSLVFAAMHADSDQLTLYRMSLTDGELTGPILERENASVETIQDDISRVVHGVGFSGFSPSYEFFDDTVNMRLRAIKKGLEGTSATLVGWSDDFRDLLIRASGGWNSGLYLLFRQGEAEPQLVAQVRPGIAMEQVVPTVISSYEASDGLEIPALVTAWPTLREEGNAALVVIPHGGPETYDRLTFDWMAQYFASRGYIVLQPQFRGSSGFGEAFADAGYGEWGGKMQSDIDDGVKHLISEGLVDPDRVCIVGASYGGYAALAAGAYSAEMYKCIVSIAGVSDLERMLKSDRRKYGRDHWAISYWRRQYGGDNFDWESLRDISPVFAAESFRAPVLLVHGRKDTVVPFEQSKVMVKALKKQKKDVTLVALKGEDHWLSYADSRLETLRAVAAFIEENL